MSNGKRRTGSAKQRRDNDRRTSSRRRKIRDKVIARDNWTCQLCGHPVDPALAGTNADGSPAMDHVTPFTDGGRYNADNLRLAHKLCNNQRSGHNLDRTL